MMDTYRVRHAIRDVGAALGLPPSEIDSLAKAFPHIRARDARAALQDLPELRASKLGDGRLDMVFRLVERLDGLPRHVALHPCGVLLSDATLLDRTPVEASWLGFPMSQFDKDDVEDLGLLKLDVLGIRMQSAMTHAIEEVARVDGGDRIDLDAVPLDDPATFRLIQSTKTLGCFQIESPGQRELIGKFGPETFEDLIIDISLFRPGPVKSDMVTPFLEARQGWAQPYYLHPSLVPVLEETGGVVVFHEQVLQLITTFTGCSLAEADEARRFLGSTDGQVQVEVWLLPDRPGSRLRPSHGRRGVGGAQRVRVVRVLQGARRGLRPADLPVGLAQGPPPGGVPRRRPHPRPGHVPQAPDPRRRPPVRHRGAVARRQPLRRDLPGGAGGGARRAAAGDPRASRRATRPSLACPMRARTASGSRSLTSRASPTPRLLASLPGGPTASLSDFWHRAGVSRPVVERLVLAGAFDSLYGIGSASTGPPPQGRLTRRDLLLQVGELDGGRGRWPRPVPPRARRVAALADATALHRVLAS